MLSMSISNSVSIKSATTSGTFGRDTKKSKSQFKYWPGDATKLMVTNECPMPPSKIVIFGFVGAKK